MTKYLGYGYTNSRGVARLQYDPNGEELEHTGYKNKNNYDTDVTAKFTNKTKEYTSNKKHYPTTDPHIEYILYDDQSTDKTNEYSERQDPTFHPSYIPNECLYFDELASLAYNTLITISQDEKWVFEVDEQVTVRYGDRSIWLLHSNTVDILWVYGAFGTNNLRLSIKGGNCDVSPNLNLGKYDWYTFKLVIDNGVVFAYCYDEEKNLIYSTSCELPTDVFNKPMQISYGTAGTWRNIKIGKVVR